MATKKTTNMKTIAAELGISVNTVSRALRDCSDISSKTKKLVREKAIELGYMPNFIQSFVKRDEKPLVALVYNRFENLFYNVMCAKYAEEIIKAGYDFTIVFTKSSKMTVDTLRQCISERADYIICLCEVEKEVVEYAAHNKSKMIFTIECGAELDVSTIHVDNSESGMLAANYLLNSHKSKKFLFIGADGILNSKTRYEAFEKTIHENIPDADVILINVDDPAKYNITKYIYKGYLNVCCYNDEQAYLMLDALNKVIPNVRKVFPHLHVIGHDALSTVIPGLVDITSISFDYDEYVNKTVQYIKDVLENGVTEKRNLLLRPSLHVRTIL